MITSYKGLPEPFAHCNSVFFNGQNGTRQYFCLNYNARRHAPTEVENKTPNIRIQYPKKYNIIPTEVEYNTHRSRAQYPQNKNTISQNLNTIISKA